jgi:hypothetical protein
MLFEIGTRLSVRVRAGLVFATMLGIAPGFAAAQETRTEEITKKQAEKAAKSAPYVPSGYEKIMQRIEDNYVSPPSGFFPYFGSVYSGGGFTLGAGYRHFYAREAVWELKGLYSIKNYKLIEFGTRTPWNGGGRWQLGMRAGWRDAPQIGYYGTGMETTTDDRANFRLKQPYGAADLSLRPTWWTRLKGEVMYTEFKNEEGRGTAPSIETRYDANSAPGLFTKIKYINSTGTAAIDWRPAEDYARRGGYYGVTFNDFADQDKTYSFRRVDGELIQHLPILRETWVLSFRGRVQTTLDINDVIPYYLLPALGSGSTLRGYSTARFRDRHSILTSAEFRWIPNRLALDMALFYDAGKVTTRRADLDFNGFKSNWGIGVRFHGPTTTPLRIELARGSDGLHLVFSSGAAF